MNIFEPGTRTGMVARRSVITLAIFLATTMIPSPAAASLLREPAANATVTRGDWVTFDWSWTSTEWESQLWFSKDPYAWTGPSVIRSDWFALSSISSGVVSLAAGEWYWRTCSHTSESADDTCILGAETRRIFVAPALFAALEPRELMSNAKLAALEFTTARPVRISSCQILGPSQTRGRCRARWHSRRHRYSAIVGIWREWLDDHELSTYVDSRVTVTSRRRR